jgi:hypothetical protein
MSPTEFNYLKSIFNTVKLKGDVLRLLYFSPGASALQETLTDHHKKSFGLLVQGPVVQSWVSFTLG